MTAFLTAADIVAAGKRAREDAEEALLSLPSIDTKRRRTDAPSPTLALKKLILKAVEETDVSPAKVYAQGPVHPDVLVELKQWVKKTGPYILDYKESSREVPTPGSVRNETDSVPVYKIKVYW